MIGNYFFLFLHSSPTFSTSFKSRKQWQKKGGYIPTDRFLDANHEPQRRLTPIQGYEKKDLVSLEETVKPLEHLIENIQGFV
jgi:hypothetical protein